MNKWFFFSSNPFTIFPFFSSDYWGNFLKMNSCAAYPIICNVNLAISEDRVFYVVLYKHYLFFFTRHTTGAKGTQAHSVTKMFLLDHGKTWDYVYETPDLLNKTSLSSLAVISPVAIKQREHLQSLLLSSELFTCFRAGVGCTAVIAGYLQMQGSDIYRGLYSPRWKYRLCPWLFLAFCSKQLLSGTVYIWICFKIGILTHINTHIVHNTYSYYSLLTDHIKLR